MHSTQECFLWIVMNARLEVLKMNVTLSEVKAAVDCFCSHMTMERKVSEHWRKLGRKSMMKAFLIQIR